jgi:hypothetical protein
MPTPESKVIRDGAERSADARPLPVAYSILEFCKAHRISQAFFYELKRAGLGPREMIVGRRRIISGEAAADWRRARAAADEAASTT